MCADSRADVISGDESLRRAWSSFITYSLCHQSKHPPVIILLNVSDWWAMEGNTINSCFFGGEEPFGCSRILNSPWSSDAAQTLSCLEILFDVLFLCVYTHARMCVCVWLKVGMYSVAQCICVCLRKCVLVFASESTLKSSLFRAGARCRIPDWNAIRH